MFKTAVPLFFYIMSCPILEPRPIFTHSCCKNKSEEPTYGNAKKLNFLKMTLWSLIVEDFFIEELDACTPLHYHAGLRWAQRTPLAVLRHSNRSEHSSSPYASPLHLHTFVLQSSPRSATGRHRHASFTPLMHS